MTRSTAERNLIAELVANFTANGFRFRMERSEFFKSNNNSENAFAVGIELLDASKPYYFKAAVTCHIRIGALESVYAKFYPLIPPEEREDHYTVDVNCDNLFVDRTVSQSFELRTTDDVSHFAQILWSAISTSVLPFLEKYCDRDRLVENLRQNDYKIWITSNRMVRYSVLISDRALADDEAGFQQYSSELLDFCQKPYGQMYLQAAQAIVSGVRSEYFQSSSDVASAPERR